MLAILLRAAKHWRDVRTMADLDHRALADIGFLLADALAALSRLARSVEDATLSAADGGRCRPAGLPLII